MKHACVSITGSRPRLCLSHRSFVAALVLLPVILSAVPPLLQSQSLTIFDVDPSGYPDMKAKFLALDASGNRVAILSAAEMMVTENGTPLPVTRVQCPAAAGPVAISSLLDIDVSVSMAPDRIRWVKDACALWVAGISGTNSECAIAGYGTRPRLVQDFTADTAQLRIAIASLSTGGESDYGRSMLSSPAGAFDVLKTAKQKKVLVLVTDGLPLDPFDVASTVARAQQEGIVIYTVVIDMPAPQDLKTISASTGGYCLDNIASHSDCIEAFRLILLASRGTAPCELEWRSAGCGTTRALHVMSTGNAAWDSQTYTLSRTPQPNLLYSPSPSLHFGRVVPGNTDTTTITVTAPVDMVHVDSIVASHPFFTVLSYGGSSPPFTIDVGQSRTISIVFTPADSSYALCRFTVSGDICGGADFFADGGWASKLLQPYPVVVVFPNGGEKLIAGSTAEIAWGSMMPETPVHLEYSTNSGASWTTVAKYARGLSFSWLVPPTPSDQCLLRISKVHCPSGGTSQMVSIPTGSFRMGNITGHEGWPDELPVKTVQITQAFLIGRTEVTQAEWFSVMGYNPSSFQGLDYDCHPIENISYQEAAAFCNRLSVLEGLDTCYTVSGGTGLLLCNFSANGYRLPTEEEWEYACRAGTETDFNLGNMTNVDCADPVMDAAGWYCGNSGGSSHVVRSKTANSWGLYDMHGNVMEWVYPFSHRRGGAFTNAAKSCRSAVRGYGGPKHDFCGFRYVRNQ